MAIGAIFSIAIVMLGSSAAVGGRWVERNGPRRAMFVSACFCIRLAISLQYRRRGSSSTAI